jgi:hypothetical protein
MVRLLFAAFLIAAFALPSANAWAGMRIVAVGHGTHKATLYKGKRHRYGRHFRAVGFAVPRCRMVTRTSYQVYWRGLACPRIAWAGSAPRQPWSYAVFRKQADWDQRIDLWQSHLRPSLSNPTIYWGY